jgi:predicted dehydrogenase
MARGWLKAIADTPEIRTAVDVVGLVDVNTMAAKALAEEFGLSDAVIGRDLGTVLAETAADMVFDVVIPAARHDVVATSLAHGCHVLSEKPMASSIEEGRSMIARAAAAGKVHAIVQNRRFISGIRRIRRLVESGGLGELTAIHCDFFIGAHFGGFREEMDNVLLLDMAIHTFDAARFVADKTSWESQWRIIGTQGTLLWDGAEEFKAQRVAGTEGFLRPVDAIPVPEPVNEAQTHGHASVIADFLAAIRTGRRPETESNDNINSLAMVFAAIESARTRQRVTL